MAQATFETPDGEEIEIDGDEVVSVVTGKDGETTVIELEDGEEVVVAASRIEVVADLGLDPLEHLDPDEDEDLAEDRYDDDE